jgi:hypothetical protein
MRQYHCPFFYNFRKLREYSNLTCCFPLLLGRALSSALCDLQVF